MDKHNKPKGGFSVNPDPEAIRKAADGLTLMVIAADVFELLNMGQKLHATRAVLESTEKKGGAAA